MKVIQKILQQNTFQELKELKDELEVPTVEIDQRTAEHVTIV